MPKHSSREATQVLRQKRASLHLAIAAVAVLAVVGVALALPRTSASPAAQSLPAAPTQAAPAATPMPAAAAPQPATAVPSVTAFTFGGAALTPVADQDGFVRLPVGDIGPQAHFYAFQGKVNTIPFFVLKSSDGVVRAAFDACDVCYLAQQGFHQEGDEMVCNNCGSRFPSARINAESGGCNPAPLERQVQGGDILIRAADLEAGAGYF